MHIWWYWEDWSAVSMSYMCWSLFISEAGRVRQVELHANTQRFNACLVTNLKTSPESVLQSLFACLCVMLPPMLSLQVKCGQHCLKSNKHPTAGGWNVHRPGSCCVSNTSFEPMQWLNILLFLGPTLCNHISANSCLHSITHSDHALSPSPSTKHLF